MYIPQKNQDLIWNRYIFLFTYVYINFLGIRVTKAEFIKYQSNKDNFLDLDKILCHSKLALMLQKKDAIKKRFQF